MSEGLPLEVIVRNRENIEDKESYLYERDPQDKNKEIVKYQKIDDVHIYFSLHDIKLHDGISYYPDIDAEEKIQNNNKKEIDIIEPVAQSNSCITGTGKSDDLIDHKKFSFFGDDYFHEEVNIKIYPAINIVPHARIRAIKPSSDGFVKEEVSMYFFIDEKKFTDIAMRVLSNKISEISVNLGLNEKCEGMYQPFSWLPHDDHRIKFLDKIDDVKNKSELPSNFKAFSKLYTTEFEVSITTHYAEPRDKEKEINDMIKKKDFYPEDIKAMVQYTNKDKIRGIIIGIVFFIFVLYLML